MAPELLPQVRAFLAESGWTAQPFEGRAHVLAFAFQGSTDTWSCFVQVDEALRQCIVYALLPFRISAARRDAVMALVTRINYGLRLGNFELDLADGEVRYKTALALADGALTAGLLQQLVAASAGSLNRHLPALQAVARDGVDPQEALAAAQGA